jgi:hypothetical protein
MSVTVSVDTSEFNRGMEKLRNLTLASDRMIVGNTARGVVMNLVRFTMLMKRNATSRNFRWLHKRRAKEAKGRARLGWWAAWKALGVNGSPKIGNGPLKDRGEGGIIDKSRDFQFPSITIFNEVPYIDVIEEKMNTLTRAMANQEKFLARAIMREYNKKLRRTVG